MFKYITYYLNLNLPEDAEPLVEYAFHVSTICLVVLFCFINVFGYLISMYLLKFYEVEKKYPKLKHYINYFNKTSTLFLIIEAVIGFGGLISLVYLGFSFLFI